MGDFILKRSSDVNSSLRGLGTKLRGAWQFPGLFERQAGMWKWAPRQSGDIWAETVARPLPPARPRQLKVRRLV